MLSKTTRGYYSVVPDSLLNPSLVIATKVVVVVAFVSTLAFTIAYVARSRWKQEPMGWMISGHQLALTLILALVGIEAFWAVTLFWADVFVEIEDALLVGVSAIMGASVIYMFRVRKQAAARHRAKMMKQENPGP